MAISLPKKKNKTSNLVDVSSKESDALANKLADKPYGKVKTDAPVVYTTTSLSLPKDMLFALQDAVRENQRRGDELKSVSAVIKHLIAEYLAKNK